MFKFKDLSEEEIFKSNNYRLSPQEFFEKRRTSKRPYVFDLRISEDFEKENIPGSNNIPIENFETSIYQMPFSGDILLYGSENGEALAAAEILYDNGFDSFNFTESFKNLIENIDPSYLQITDQAQIFINNQLRSSNLKVLKILVEPTSALKANYTYKFEESHSDSEIQFEKNSFKIAIERKNSTYIEGTIIEINKDGELEVINPNLSISKLSGSLEEQIQTLLDEQVNPMLASHGGNVMLEGIKDESAYLRFGGGCQGCSMIDTTVKQGVEVMLKEAIPKLAGVFDITDHSEGESPFYKE